MQFEEDSLLETLVTPEMMMMMIDEEEARDTP